MHLADRPFSPQPHTIHPASPATSELNRGTYDRLKLALSLSLRRQVFVAVCDDLALRNRLATQLHADLDPSSHLASLPEHLGSVTPKRLLQDLVQESTSETYPRLVTLTLNLIEPDPVAQAAEWLILYPPPNSFQATRQFPAFQLIGAENLMRQSAPVQQRFLMHLQQIERSLSSLESSLLLWLTRPWFHAVQQSAPAFWNCHTALFEFEGDPTPAPTSETSDSGSAASIAPDPGTETHQAALTLEPDSLNSVVETELESVPLVADDAPIEITELLDNDPSVLDDDLWDVLTYDLSLLDDEAPEELEAAPESPIESSNGFVAHAEQTLSFADDVILSDAEPDLAIESNGHYSTVSPFAESAIFEPADIELADLELADLELADLELTDVELTSEFDSAPTETISVDSEVLAAPDLRDLVPDPTPLSSLIAELYPGRSLPDVVRASLPPSAMTEPTTEESEILQTLGQIERLHATGARGDVLAVSYETLGDCYRDRVEKGDTSETTLIIAICAYEQVLTHLKDEKSPFWSDGLNDIGNLYWMLSRRFTDSETSLTYLNQGIAVYQLALARTDPYLRPQSYAMIQNNLGSAYGDLARYQATPEVLEQSVRAYEEALRYRQFEDDPARYAATQNNLGTAYWNLAQHRQPVVCLRRSIAAYQESLRYYNRDQEPLHYAMIQNNLGTAFWNLSQHAKSCPDEAAANGQGITATELLHQAIKAYSTALQFRTLETAPAAHAATQNNLGTAYWHLASLTGIATHDRQECLQQAIAAYKASLAAVHYLQAAATNHAPALTFDPHATQNNLGLAYYQLATDVHIPLEKSQRSSYLESALQHQVQALQGWEDKPEFYSAAFGFVVQTVRTFYSEFGMQGQSLALAKVPARLLPELLKQL